MQGVSRGTRTQRQGLAGTCDEVNTKFGEKDLSEHGVTASLRERWLDVGAARVYRDLDSNTLDQVAVTNKRCNDTFHILARRHSFEKRREVGSEEVGRE